VSHDWFYLHDASEDAIIGACDSEELHDAKKTALIKPRSPPKIRRNGGVKTRQACVRCVAVFGKSERSLLISITRN